MTTNIHYCVNTLKAEKRIKIEGHIGFWSVIDDLNGFVLLEHNTYGDEAGYFVVKANKFKWKEITLKSGEKITVPFFESSEAYETYDNIRTALEDYDLI